MRAAISIATKDLRSMVRDRSAIIIGIVAPFALAALFSVILGGLEEGFEARWGFVDLDHGPIATALREGPVDAITRSGVTLDELADEAAARSAVQKGQVATVIVIPEGFSAAVLAGSGGTVDLVVDADAALSAQIARSLLTGFAHQVEAVQLAVAVTVAAAPGSAPDAAAIADEAAALPAPISVRDLVAADHQLGSTTYYAAAMAILFVFLASQMGVTSLHTEKRQRTLSRMLAAPLSWRSIVLGKVIVSVVLALLSMSIIVAGTSLLLGASWGDPLGVAALLGAAALSATGVALLAVSVTKTVDQAASAIAVVSMLMAILGGSFFPPDQGPELLAQLSLLTPHAWFMRGIEGTASGGGIQAAGGPFAVLTLVGVVCGGIGLLRMRRLVLG
jgi:ABC-2 type transport system permease protein